MKKLLDNKRHNTRPDWTTNYYVGGAYRILDYVKANRFPIYAISYHYRRGELLTLSALALSIIHSIAHAHLFCEWCDIIQIKIVYDIFSLVLVFIKNYQISKRDILINNLFCK